MLKQIWQTQLTDTKTTDVEGVGRLRYEDDGTVYRWVKNTESATALAQGQCCCHQFTDGATALQNVKIPATAMLGFMGGIVMATAGIAAASYGWIQVLGLNTVCQVFASQTTAKTAGISLKAANAVTYVDTDTAMGTAPTNPRHIQLLDAIATVTTGASAAAKVFIRNM